MSANWVTIKVFNLPHEAAILQSMLDAEGIPYILEDSNLVQTYNFMSQAVGGVKLKVPSDQAEIAVQLMKDSGFLPEEEQTSTPFWSLLDKHTHNWPIIGKQRVELRLFIIAGVITLVFLLCVLLYEHMTQYY